MAKGASYRVAFRRRREGKTDYKARRALLMSNLHRLVTRGSLRHMTVQIVAASSIGDKVITSASSQELKKYGWQAACGNLPSAYLTGLLCGVRGMAKNVSKAVADIGLHQPSRGARIFASLKGVIDAGINVPHDTAKLPDENRLRGHHISDYAQKLASSDAENYQKMFSRYLEKQLSLASIPDHFDATKERILSPMKKTQTRGKGRKTEA